MFGSLLVMAIMLQFNCNQIPTLPTLCALNVQTYVYLAGKTPQGLINCIFQLPSYVTWA